MTVAPIIAPQGLDAPAECDIIMKGGITSGVVYPLAIAELAKTYRFRNIGGTSAGAIAAALTAAAELGRNVPGAGFEKLETLPEELGCRLLSLFQPSPETRPAFAVLLSFLGNDSKLKKTLRALPKILQFHGLAAILSALLGAALWFLLVMLPLGADREKYGTWILLAIVALLCGGLGAIVRFLQGSWTALNANGFGLCNGLDRGKGQEDPLTPWLAKLLNTTAGRHPEGEPLTFGDLWGPGKPEKPSDHGDQEADPSLRRINLEVMTTNLTHGWPLRIPFTTKDLFFDPKELGGYFPPGIITWMEKHHRPPSRPGSMTDLILKQGRFCPLPAPADLPVVVAARMSLSFPGLISAVPLHAVDWTRPENLAWRKSPDEDDDEPQPAREKASEAPTLSLCWFSDGGIGSNFPVHFFDGLLPSRPTFGINLRPFSAIHRQDENDESQNLEFPQEAGEGVAPTWTPIPDAFGFAKAILNTMQNWVDNTQMRLPGYRDRVVHVLLSDLEGGMNLQMSPPLIEKLTLRGKAAGRALAGFHWNGHRWIRYLTAMSQLEVKLGAMEKVYTNEFRSFLVSYDSRQKPYAHSGVWKDSAVAGTDELMVTVRAWTQSRQPFTKKTPKPEPELRIGPKR